MSFFEHENFEKAFPDHFQQVMSVISSIRETRPHDPNWPAAFGGYFRDVILSAKPVDLDVQIFDSRWVIPEGWAELTAADMVNETGDESFHARFKTWGEYAMLPTDLHRTIHSVGYFKVPGIDVPVNIVKMDGYLATCDLLQLPDFGINQFVFSAYRMHLRFSVQAEKDVRQRRMTWNAARGLESLQRSVLRAKRIVGRLGAQGIHLTADFSAAHMLAKEQRKDLGELPGDLPQRTDLETR